MNWLIDTNIAICLRDGEATVNARFVEVATALPISVVTLVELEGGIYRDRNTRLFAGRGSTFC